MFIINRYDRIMISEMNEALGTNLPLDPNQYITPWNTSVEYPINMRMDIILKQYPTHPVIILTEKINKLDWREQVFYKNQWSRVPKIVSRESEVIYYGNEKDYVVISNREVLKTHSYGIAMVIRNILAGMNDPMNEIDKEIYKYLQTRGHQHSYIMNQILQTEKAFEDEAIRTQVDVMSRGLEFDASIVEVYKYKPTDLDRFKLKLLNLWVFAESPCLDLIKEFKGKGQKFDAEIFVKGMKSLFNIKIPLEKIWVDVEEVQMDNMYMDYYDFRMQFEDEITDNVEENDMIERIED